MSSGWELVAVSLIVAGAAAYLVRRAWRSWRFSGRGCGGSCGCSGTKREDTSAGFIPADQLTLRSSMRHDESRAPD